ncbi:hypothetical protein Bca4012_005323 [Brassica carinata]
MRKFPGLYYASSSFCLVEALVRVFSVVVTSGSEPSSLGARRLDGCRLALSGGDLDWFDASLREERSSVEERWWFRRRLFGLMSSVGTSFAARQFWRCFQAVTVEWRRKRCVSLRRS